MTMEQHKIRNKGLLNLPGITPETKILTERLLLTDAEEHHCYFRSAGLHNHLSHQVLATYDMGASIGVIKKIYDMVAVYQRSIYVKEADREIVVTEDNWPECLGNQDAYGAYFKFFREEVKRLGPSAALESYVFRPEANDNGKNMLDRFLSGALHPFIQVGYAAEFGNDILMATGLAQTAIHKATLAEFFSYSSAWGDDNVFTPTSPATGRGRQPSAGPSLLSILREIYDAHDLAPPLPYNPDLLISQRIKAAVEGKKSNEILRIAQKYTQSIPNDASDEELESRIEELIWAATLLMFATGRPGKEPRLDFFLMHLVTSSLFLEPVCRVLKSARAKVALIRHYLHVFIVIMLSRGRPLIRASLVQEWTEKPRPPSWGRMLGVEEVKSSGAGDIKEGDHKTLSSLIQEALRNPEGWKKIVSVIPLKRDEGESPLKAEKSVGDLKEDEDYNPWPLLIQGALHHPDLHLAKAMRTLIFASRRYGSTGPGDVIGAFRCGTSEKSEETFEGMSQLDGTLFVRAAGVMMDFAKWTLSGDLAKGSLWDRSVLGYDAAWAN